jgi:site-specific DNA-methyltransferase (adenine-specific)
MVVFYHNDQDYDLTGLLTQGRQRYFIDEKTGLDDREYIPELYNRFCKCLWKKTNPLPVANKNYVPDYEPWIHAWNLPAFDIQGTLEEKRRIIEAPVGKSEYDHPTVKPLEIMRKCVTNASKPGDIVIDPFAGSGSTGVAALSLGRLFIGIERDEEYYDLTIHRIKGILGAYEAGDDHEGQTILI